MKNLKLITLLFIFSLSLFSCKKGNSNNNSPANPLLGSWHEISGAQNTSIYFETYKGNTFITHHYDTLSKEATISTGTFTSNNNNLQVIIREKETIPFGGTSTSTPFTDTLFKDGQFSIKDYILTITYTNSMNGKPVKTTSRYFKDLPDVVIY